ncbi:hypothetical protein [Roseicitreum antarcticum]|uniref:hypothetical protein n=1 Tax=Roseicitreum antarcticum TaxID=564137 RepID=UPI001CC1F281|nr:hypothetical protein [Roseicitreum antarcticum]
MSCRSSLWLAGVSRLVAKLDPSKVDTKDEGAVTRIMLGLQEVDPSIAVDGLEITDDHETPIEGFSEADQS